MDMLSLLQSAATFSAFLVVIYVLWTIKPSLAAKSHAKKLPEPPGAWLLIGHFKLLGRKLPVFRALGALANKHSPIFAIRLGTKRAVVLSSWEVMKECLSTNDQVLLNRPLSTAKRHLAYGRALFGFSPYGPCWREVRKIVALEPLSNRRLDDLAEARVSEVENSISDLHSLCLTASKEYGTTCSAVKVDMSQWFAGVAMNSMVRMISGKRHSATGEESRRFGKAVIEFLELNGLFLVSDFIPCTEWLGLGGKVTCMKLNAAELREIMSGLREEHRRNWRDIDGRREKHDFIDAVLSLVGDGNGDGDGTTASIYYGLKSETVVKATVLVSF